MREMVAMTLRGAGFHVIQADDGVNALKVLADNEVDIIITDLNMPNMPLLTAPVSQCKTGHLIWVRELLPQRTRAREDDNEPDMIQERPRVCEYSTCPPPLFSGAPGPSPSSFQEPSPALQRSSHPPPRWPDDLARAQAKPKSRFKLQGPGCVSARIEFNPVFCRGITPQPSPTPLYRDKTLRR